MTVTKVGGASMIAHAQWPQCPPFPRVAVFYVTPALLPERGRDKRRMELTKKPQPHLNMPQVKQILCCERDKFDRAISQKAAAERAPLYHQYIQPGNHQVSISCQ